MSGNEEAPRVYEPTPPTSCTASTYAIEEVGYQLANIANELAAMRGLLERNHKEVHHAPGHGLVTQKPADTQDAPGEGLSMAEQMVEFYSQQLASFDPASVVLVEGTERFAGTKMDARRDPDEHASGVMSAFVSHLFKTVKPDQVGIESLPIQRVRIYTGNAVPKLGPPFTAVVIRVTHPRARTRLVVHVAEK